MHPSRFRSFRPNTLLGAVAITLFAALAAQPAFAQTETVLYSFSCSRDGWCADGEAPNSLTVDSAGNLYGTAYYGGTGVGGTAFKVTPAGEESLLYSFTRADEGGWGPEGPFIFDSQGNLYGTTSSGGTNSIHVFVGDGTVFQLSPDGTETTLYNFGAYGTDGIEPGAGLVMDAKGNFYGTTVYGGTNRVGTVFRLTPEGVETIVHNFSSNGGDGFDPGPLIMDSKGNIYGTTSAGGSGASGTGIVFEITAAGSYSILHSFDTQGDGYYPNSLTLDGQGNLYGSTSAGGSNIGQYGGTVYKLTPNSNGTWTETILYNFSDATGACHNPVSNVVLDTKGNVYGTAWWGGTFGGGCAFELSPAGKFTLLHAFGNGTDASGPLSLVSYEGNLYGTSGSGGASGNGAVFKITPKTK